MPRGPPTLLSTAIFTKLFHQNPEHPRIRKHQACVQVIHYYLLHSYSDSTKHKLSPNRTPSQVKILCDSYNFNYLNRPNDSKLSSLCIWRIIYRRLKPNTDSINLNPSHEVIYIQQRHLSPDEINLSVPKRKQALCHNQIGPDFHTIKNNISIIQPKGTHLIYMSTNLHCRHHGSHSLNELPDRKQLCEHLGIQFSSISPENAGWRGLQHTNNVYVLYSQNKFLQKLDHTLVCGLSRLHYDLTVYLLNNVKTTDASRMEGKIIQSSPSLDIRLSFGFGRIQRDVKEGETWKVQRWQYKNKEMPTLKFQTFTILPKILQSQLLRVFESGQIFAESNMTNVFPNHLRTKIFAKRLNNALGFPHSRTKFEYYDIVLSCNLVLLKHLDTKNDHRKGYNICVVYSFYQIIEGVQYKISIIMTTRSTVGCAIDNIK